MENTQNSTTNAVRGYGYDEEDGRGYGTWSLGLTDFAAADHIGKAIGRVYAAAERTYAGYQYGRDELDERGIDAGHVRLAVPFGLTVLSVLWIAAGLAMSIGGAR